jgi:hypothetical protein
MYYLADLTTQQVLGWAEPPKPHSPYPTLIWEPLFTRTHFFLHFLTPEPAQAALADAKAIEPTHDIQVVFVPDFMTNRSRGLYDHPSNYLATTQDDLYRQAFEEGTEAKHDNRPQSDNPYSITDLQGIGWLNGWLAGELETVLAS